MIEETWQSCLILSEPLSCFVLILFISCKRYLIIRLGKYPGIAEVLAVKTDVKPRNMNFEKVESG